MSIGSPISVKGAQLRSAQALAARGWLVFPCVPDGKRPALRGNWQDLATTSLDRVRVWWAAAPYNIGIACGRSGLVVIDLDIPHLVRPGERPADTENGTDAFAALCEQYSHPYPTTYAVDTPSGGCHLYYAAPATRVRNSAGRLGQFIDVRAEGGYVIGAGSRIGESSYTARDERTPVPLPSWISDLLANAPSTPGSTPFPRLHRARGAAYAMAALRDETRLVATARPGSRNDRLNRAAFNLGQLVAAELLPLVAVVTALASAAERAGLPRDEAQRTIRSGVTAGSRYPRKG